MNAHVHDPITITEIVVTVTHAEPPPPAPAPPKPKQRHLHVVRSTAEQVVEKLTDCDLRRLTSLWSAVFLSVLEDACGAFPTGNRSLPELIRTISVARRDLIRFTEAPLRPGSDIATIATFAGIDVDAAARGINRIRADGWRLPSRSNSAYCWVCAILDDQGKLILDLPDWVSTQGALAQFIENKRPDLAHILERLKGAA
jgi:hypothetical protein